jgi:predicted membrane-bound mannosyltransferase
MIEHMFSSVKPRWVRTFAGFWGLVAMVAHPRRGSIDQAWADNEGAANAL